MFVDFIPNMVFLNIIAIFILFFGFPLTYSHDLSVRKTFISKVVVLFTINLFVISVGAFVAWLEQLYYQVEEQVKEYLNLLNLLKEGLIVKTTVDGEDKILFANQAAKEILMKESGKVASHKSRRNQEIDADILSQNKFAYLNFESLKPRAKNYSAEEKLISDGSNFRENIAALSEYANLQEIVQRQMND